MKKLFIALLFSAVLFIGLPFYNVSAMSVTYDIPFSYVPDAADLFLGMLSGGQYDLSNASTLEEAIQQHKDSLQQGYHFLQRFATNLWNWQVTQAGLGNTTLNEDSDMAIYVTPSDIAAFMGYNLKWWEREKVPSDVIIVNPPVDTSQNILNYIDYINGSGFDFFYNKGQGVITVHGYNNTIYNTLSPTSPFESFTIYNNKNNNLYSDWGNFTNITDAFWISPNGIDSIYITSNGNNYTCTISKPYQNIVYYDFGFSYDTDYNNSSITSSSRIETRLYGNFYFNSSVALYGGCNPFYSTSWSTKTFNGSLEDIFYYLSCYVRNAYIYVDGVLWSNGAGLSIPDDYISAPDVIQVGDTGIESYDVFIPDIPGYGGLSINGFLEWLNTRLGDKDVGLDDLIEDAPDIVIGVDENDQPTIRPITYDDTRPAPIVIDTDTTANPDPDNPTPTPTPDPTTFPLPPFPKFPIPSDIPNANIQHTVLAEIIDATQSVVPQDLMVLIWSTFSLLIIGGIIYILHK